MINEQHLLVTPGLGDDVGWMRWETDRWTKYGLISHVEAALWGDLSEGLDEKLERLVNNIDRFSKEGLVSLLGTSAGGSLVLNAFCLRRDKVNKVVILSGRMRSGDTRPTLKEAAQEFKAFEESVLLAERNERKLSPLDRAKILTVRGLRDGIVPISTTPIDGATNLRIPMVGHIASMAFAMTVFKRPIIEFLTS